MDYPDDASEYGAVVEPSGEGLEGFCRLKLRELCVAF
jgi:hypothetical protein